MKIASLYLPTLLLSMSVGNACTQAQGQTRSSDRKGGDVRIEGQLEDETGPGRTDMDEDQQAQEQLGTADCYKADQEICQVEKQIYEIVNQERQKQGLSPLAYNAKAAYVARLWSQDQARMGRIGHDGWPSDREREYYSEFNDTLNTNAENVAMSGGGQASTIAAELMDMWMNSSGHRRNILGRSAGIGVGIAVTRNGQFTEWYGTQLFTAR